MSRATEPAPLGRFHPSDRCAFCGVQWAHMAVVIVKPTHALGLRCVDTVACLRRSSRRQQLQLEL